MPNLARPVPPRRLAAGLLALALVPGLAGCFNGFGATTTVQASMNSGNGTQAKAGAIRIDNATVVLGPEGSSTGTLTMRVTNDGAEPDTITGITIQGAPAYVTGETVEVPGRSSVSFGYASDIYANSYALEAEVSTYVPVTVTLAKAGQVAMQVLTVPPVGYYEGIAPNPPQDPTRPLTAPSPTP